MKKSPKGNYPYQQRVLNLKGIDLCYISNKERKHKIIGGQGVANKQIREVCQKKVLFSQWNKDRNGRDTSFQKAKNQNRVGTGSKLLEKCDDGHLNFRSKSPPYNSKSQFCKITQI